MQTRTFYGVFYILLLSMTSPALCVQQKLNEKLRSRLEVDDESKLRVRRQVAVGPIALYAGVAVSPWVWLALVLAYGIALVISYNVSRTTSDSHSCANNRGWCRPSCFGHEYEDSYNTPVCGRFKCCRPRNMFMTEQFMHRPRMLF